MQVSEGTQPPIYSVPRTPYPVYSEFQKFTFSFHPNVHPHTLEINLIEHQNHSAFIPRTFIFWNDLPAHIFLHNFDIQNLNQLFYFFLVIIH